MWYHTIPFNTIHIPKSDFPSKIVLLSIIKRAKLTLAYSIKCPMWILYVRIQKCLVKICHFYAAPVHTRIAHEAKGKIQREKKKKTQTRIRSRHCWKKSFTHKRQNVIEHLEKNCEACSYIFFPFLFHFILFSQSYCFVRCFFFFIHWEIKKERKQAALIHCFMIFFNRWVWNNLPMYLISSSRSIRQLPRQNMFYIRIAKRSKCTKCSDSSRIEIMKTTSLILVCNWRALKRQIIYLILTSATVPLISFAISFSFSNAEKKKITEMEEYSEAISIHGFERKEWIYEM